MGSPLILSNSLKGAFLKPPIKWEGGVTFPFPIPKEPIGKKFGPILAQTKG